MGNPSVSVRKYYHLVSQWPSSVTAVQANLYLQVPNEPSEPTSSKILHIPMASHFAHSEGS